MARIYVIFIAVLLGYIIVKLYVKPQVLDKYCWTGTASCMKIDYWAKENSALINVSPSGYWIWFNGENVYIY